MFDYDVDTGEIWLYDAIGPAWAGMIDAASVIAVFKEMSGRDIILRVSSPGGSVWDAIDIYNAIERYSGRVVAEVDAIAASAASFLILAADEVVAAKNATLMIHRGMSATFGNLDDHKKKIELLETVDASLVSMYRKKTGKPNDEIEAAMAEETWFTAEQAKEFGLVDRVAGASDVTASVPEGMFAKTPDYLRVQAKAGTNTKYPVLREAARIRNRGRRCLTR